MRTPESRAEQTMLSPRGTGAREAAGRRSNPREAADRRTGAREAADRGTGAREAAGRGTDAREAAGRGTGAREAAGRGSGESDARGRFGSAAGESVSERTMISTRGGPRGDRRGGTPLDDGAGPARGPGRGRGPDRDWNAAGARDRVRGGAGRADDDALGDGDGVGHSRRPAGSIGRFGSEDRARSDGASSSYGRLAALDDTGSHPGAGTEENTADAPADPGMALFWRRLVIALVWLGFALGLGVGAGLVWEKVRPSGDAATVAAAPTTPAAVAPAAAPASPTATAAPTPAVPADWVAYTATTSNAESTFSHPSSWTIHSDNTAVLFIEPDGPRMVGVARRVGVDGAGAVSKVQALEFNGQPGFAVTGSGPVKDPVSGATVQELTGTYTRQGVKVAYMLHSVDGQGASYVLIVRVPAATSSELDTLMLSLRASFHPAG